MLFRIKGLSVIAALVLATFSSVVASAATVTVIADVNAAANRVGNRPLYDAILGSSTSVLFSRNDAQQFPTFNFYNGKSGVTATESGATLTSSILSSVDLLVITRNFNNAVNYTAAEISSIASFVQGGGDVLVVLEAPINSGLFGGYNSLLSGIGTAIRYTGGRGGTSTDFSLADTDISNSTMSFQGAAVAHLSGGDAVAINANGDVFVATETIGTSSGPAVIPVPASLPLLAGGLLVMAGLRRRRSS